MFAEQSLLSHARATLGRSLAVGILLAMPGALVAQLASWNDGPSKTAILAFVRDVTAKGGPSYVAPEDRIAVFDNDGTLWAEQPIYFQAAFMLDQVKAAAPRHPEWQDDPAFQALASHDPAALASIDVKALLRLLATANSGSTVTAYDSTTRRWLRDARHPRFKRPYTDLVYRPMQELLAYLREQGFKTFIVSGGSIEFMRTFADTAYGIPPEQVVGSIFGTRYDTAGGRPVLVRTPDLVFMDDGPGKPVGIYRSIGRRPILAFGNSDGDLQMLEWTAAGHGPRFMGLVHHTDAGREYAYDRQSRIGRLDKALDAAAKGRWTVVDMARDWKRVFAFE